MSNKLKKMNLAQINNGEIEFQNNEQKLGMEPAKMPEPGPILKEHYDVEALMAPITASAQAPLEEGTSMPEPVTVVKKTRNRLTKAQYEALSDKVLHLLEAGHPELAIILKLGISKATLTQITLNLIKAQKYTDKASSYGIYKGGCPIKDIEELGITKNDYIRIEYNDVGQIVISRFNQEKPSFPTA